jgi:vesicle coat complex subunit
MCPAVQELKDKHKEVMQEMLMDVLRVLSSPNLDIRKKTLDIAMELITARNIDEVGRSCCLGGVASSSGSRSGSSAHTP